MIDDATAAVYAAQTIRELSQSGFDLLVAGILERLAAENARLERRGTVVAEWDTVRDGAA